MRLGGTTIVDECSFLSNSATSSGFAVVAVRQSVVILNSSFDSNELYCEADSYRHDTEVNSNCKCTYFDSWIGSSYDC